MDDQKQIEAAPLQKESTSAETQPTPPVESATEAPTFVFDGTDGNNGLDVGAFCGAGEG